MKITLISFKMRESSLGTPVGNDDAVLSSFSVLPELLKHNFFIFYFDIPILDLGTLYFSFCLTSQVIYKQPKYESFGDSKG